MKQRMFPCRCAALAYVLEIPHYEKFWYRVQGVGSLREEAVASFGDRNSDAKPVRVMMGIQIQRGGICRSPVLPMSEQLQMCGEPLGLRCDNRYIALLLNTVETGTCQSIKSRAPHDSKQAMTAVLMSDCKAILLGRRKPLVSSSGVRGELRVRELLSTSAIRRRNGYPLACHAPHKEFWISLPIQSSI